MTLAWCAVLWLATTLEQARQLAWEKQFAAAEKLYREVLRTDPSSRDARFGLAQVLLWEGRYPEARRMFQALDGNDAREGAATAAYWQGDFRTAAREFAALPDRKFARQSLAEIRAASAGDDRAAIEGIDDNQPFRAWRASVSTSIFSDPLTRWDFAAGAYGMHNIDRAVTRNEPFVSATNSYVLPWQRLTITSTVGALKFPDASTRPIGGITVTEKIANSSIAVAVQHRELLTNATSIDAHPSVTTYSASWTRYVDQGWIAGAEAGSNRYFDRNSGTYVQGYALWPALDRVRVGFSFSQRDTDETRFALDAVSATRTGSFFTYRYRGSYRGYWTPIDFREVRAIVSADSMLGRVQLKAQAEAGVGRDTARAFGPSSGLSQLPSNIFMFDFRRTFHPYRLAAGAAIPIDGAYKLQVDIERNVTVFYAANAFRASLVRHR